MTLVVVILWLAFLIEMWFWRERRAQKKREAWARRRV